MKTLLKYYWNPLVLAIATIGYFSLFFLPVTGGGVSGVLAANIILLFVALAGVAWLVAGVQVVMGVVRYRKRSLSWKHHVASAIFTCVCYAIVAALFCNGYYLTA